jgi:hypothetical protein
MIFNLARDSQHTMARAVIRYVSKHFGELLNHDHKRMHKLTVRMSKIVGQIEVLASYRDSKGEAKVSGKKIVLVAHFLTQLIFNKYDGNITPEYVKIAKITARLIEFNNKFFEKNVSENDAGKLMISAEKFAEKMFKKFYS